MPSSSPPPINSNNKPAMDQKPNGQLADPHPLKCPRCDSSNTKFCYYNNYSLSQPRHFCKACKRYWTRGGTLRNVPVGGGCRKNKRTKRPLSNDAVSGQSTAIATPTGAVHRLLDLPPAAASHNHLFYNPIELNFPFSNFRVSNTDHNNNNNSGFDFSSSGLNVAAADHHVGVAAAMSSDFKNGFKPIQDPFMFGSNSNFGSTSSTMASLLAMKGGMPYEDPGKDVKLQGGNRPVWNPNPNPNPIHDQINNNNPSDPSSSTSFVWNNTNLGAWFDPSSMGSSVPSLI